MKLKEGQLTVQVENLVDFASLTRHECDLSSFLRYQDLSGYFTMLDGPTYENLVRYFWVRVEIYDKNVARLEEHEKVLIDPSVEGKTREELGLKPFTETEIRSNIMGIPVTITEDVIARACRITVKGSIEENLNSVTSHCKGIVKDYMFKGNAKGKYKDMQKEHKVLQKLMQECFLPKAGGVDQLSSEHKVFLHFFVTFEKVNLPKYIFHHMLCVLKEIQEKNRTFILYGRLLLEIFHQGGILEPLKLSKVVNDDQLGTVVGKYINGTTLKHIHLVKEVVKMETDMKESNILSNLMDDFPPISKQYPIDVQAAFVYDHWKTT